MSIAEVPVGRMLPDAAGQSYRITMDTDRVVVEEPLEIRVGRGAEAPGTPYAVVMRTPGDDFDLAVGLAITESIVSKAEEIDALAWGAPADFNAVELSVAEEVALPDPSTHRPWLSTASCGLCGKDSVQAIAVAVPTLSGVGPTLTAAVLAGLPTSLRGGQEIFAATGGLHAAGAFRPDGELIVLREDIGRHNAVDKVIGHLAREGMLPGHDLVLAVSARAGFEIVQKAAAAEIPVLVAVSAPSSLAISLAESVGMTLAAFVRNGTANLYAGAGRIV